MRAASAELTVPCERAAHGDVVGQLTQLQRLVGQVAVGRERLGARRGGGVGDTGGHWRPRCRAAAARPRLVYTSQSCPAPIRWNRAPCARRHQRPVDGERRARGDDDVVAGVGGERHGDRGGGVGPSVGQGAHGGRPAGAERPVVRRQDLRGR